MNNRVRRLLQGSFFLIVVGLIGLLRFIYLAPETAARLAVEGERERAGLVRKEVKVGELTYVYLDGGQGEPLVLLHGFGANKDNFARVAKYLTPHYRVIAPDHIGFGESSKPQDADYAPPAQAQRLHQFIAALGLSSVHVGGSSMGGHIGATWAAAYPQEVKSLWLLGAAGIWSAPPSELATRMKSGEGNLLTARTTDDFARVFAFVMSQPPYIPRPILDVFAQERIRNYDLEQRIFTQLLSDSIEERIRGLPTPGLVVTGDQDRAIHPDTAKIYGQLLPKSQVLVYPEVGHLPMMENVQGSAEDYLKFRSSL